VKDLTIAVKVLYVYMMTNANRGVLYTGVTNSLVRRVWQHQQGEIEGFTKRYKLNRLVYYESFERAHDAISREKELKGWSRAKKNALIQTKNPKWSDLSAILFQPARDPSPSARLRMTTKKAYRELKMFRGLGAILFKEFISMMRDPLTLFFMLFPPLVEMIAFGYALDNDVKHMAMVVLNEDHTVESRQLVDRFVNTETFRVVGEVQSVDQLASEIRKGKAYVGLQIPPHFTRDLRAGYPAQLQMLIDGSNSTTALQALNTGVALTLSDSVKKLMHESGIRHVPVEVRPQMLYNPTMRSPNFFVPGVIGVVLQIGTTFATAMAVVKERERGTLEQLLVSPLSSWGLMLGKLIPYLCLGMTMAVLLFAIMRFVFFVPIAGSVIAMMLSTFVYVFALLSLGLLVATKAENQMQALQISMAFILPSVFFSGFIFPRETMPAIFYALGAILPTTYFIALMRAIILRGASFLEFWPSLAIMTAMAILLFCVCALRFRKKIG
jgi:ABC-2 type transport system permease protein